MTLSNNDCEPSSPAPQPCEEVRNIADLRPHPRNSELFTESEAEDQLLADDIKENGLQHAVEILPNGTIIGGHRRWRALQRNEETTVRCLVRYDIEAEGPEAVEAWLIKDNLLRRQLQPMAKARACEALVKVQRRGRRCDGRKVRDDVGKLLRMSGRQVSRYVSLLALPRVLQDAIDDGSLPMATASLIVALPAAQHLEIGERMGRGEAPAAAAAPFLAKHAKQACASDKGEPSIVSLASRVFQQCDELKRRCAGPLNAEDRKMLESAVDVLRSMLDRAPLRRRRGPHTLA